MESRSFSFAPLANPSFLPFAGCCCYGRSRCGRPRGDFSLGATPLARLSRCAFPRRKFSLLVMARAEIKSGSGQVGLAVPWVESGRAGRKCKSIPSFRVRAGRAEKTRPRAQFSAWDMLFSENLCIKKFWPVSPTKKSLAGSGWPIVGSGRVGIKSFWVGLDFGSD